MTIWELIKELANWVGWLPITLVVIIMMLLGKYFYGREIKFKDLQIGNLKDDLEDSKQYRIDLLVQSLEQRVKSLNGELERLNGEKETEQRKKKEIEQEKDAVYRDLEQAQKEVNALKEDLERYENALNELGDNEPDYCGVCEVDGEHIMANTIGWGFSGEKLIGDTMLIEKQGECLYCGASHLKCKICGSTTGIDTNSPETECEGGCGNVYRLVINHDHYDIEIVRNVSE